MFEFKYTDLKFEFNTQAYCILNTRCSNTHKRRVYFFLLSFRYEKKKIELKPFNPEDAFVNSVDPDETAHNEPSHQDLHVCHSVLGLQLSPFWQQWMFPKCRAGSNLASILYKSKVGRYRPVSYPDGPITARFKFM